MYEHNPLLLRYAEAPSESPNNVVDPSCQIEDRAAKGSMFKYAHSFSIHNPLMAERIEIGDTGSSALKWLAAHAMSGVEHNSSARDPPPRCYDGTRSDMITEIRDLLCHPQPKKRFLWVCGPPGVGKSAITQTLAETEAKEARLGATLFFPPSSPLHPSHPPTSGITVRDDDSRVWITISYRLATQNPSYLAYVREQIDRDPKLVEQSMEQQFETLIVEPIGRRKVLQIPHPLPILIDGLDQYCGKSSESQKRIIQLIIEFAQNYPSAPLVWIITSRPEEHLVRTFKKYSHLQDHFMKLLIPVESDDARRDVQYFLRSRFDGIQDDYDTIEPLPWPEENDFNDLLRAVSGLFILASAIVDFVGDREIADPMTQFDAILPMIAHQSPATILHKDPLLDVHRIYAQILQSVPKDYYRTARRILGFLLLPHGFGVWTRDSTPFWALCNILDIKKNVAYACLSRLHSLMEVPKLEDATTLPARFFHHSFARYLANREYSKDFWIDLREVVADLWHCHFRVLQEVQLLAVPHLTAIRLTWSSTADHAKRFRLKFWENARRVFLHHILPCPSHPCIFGTHYDGLSDTKKTTELIGILQKIHFHNLVDGYVFPDVPYRFLEFLNWVVQEGNSLLRSHNLLQDLDVSDQDYHWIDDRGTSFKIEDTRQDDGGHLTTFRAYTDRAVTQSLGQVDPSRLFSTREQPGSFSELSDDLMSHKDGFSIAIILGPSSAGPCGILMDAFDKNHTLYYVLSYKSNSS